ncbi:MAG: PP2C family protein-serine/threonine phosphatase [Phycisphaerae bacterium]
MAKREQPIIDILDSGDARVDAITALLDRRGFASQRRAIGAPAAKRKPAVALIIRGEGCDAAIDEAATRLHADGVKPVIWGVPDGFTLADGTRVHACPADAGVEEVAGVIAAAASYVPIVSRLEKEISQLERVGQQLARYFEDVDNEMRLAGRLQRDFLPQRPPKFPGVKFAHVYRPASWVSGDLFDIIKLDAQHVGMFIGDAMGHGASAALLTMFVRRSLQTHRDGPPIEIVSPDLAIAGLHTELEKQELPHSQFVTAAYAVLNAATRELRCARGGHPFPLRVSPSGEISEITPDGGLLGICGLPAEFGLQTLTLEVGEKVLFYTDGLEELFIKRRNSEGLATEFGPELCEWAKQDVDGFCRTLEQALDGQEGSLNPADDVTVVGMQITAP